VEGLRSRTEEVAGIPETVAYVYQTTRCLIHKKKNNKKTAILLFQLADPYSWHSNWVIPEYDTVALLQVKPNAFALPANDNASNSPACRIS
jgi:hypothetical protein